MKLLLLSDLHNEFAVFKPAALEADLVVLTGDIDVGLKGARWAIKTFSSIPILYVAGNHEYYTHHLPSLLKEFRALSAQTPHFYFLENARFITENVRFLGCTLWTDFLLFGPEKKEISGRAAEKNLADFSQILISGNSSARKIRFADFIRFNTESLAFLKKELSRPYNGKTVLLSHHAPLPESVPEKFKNHLLSAAFASDLRELIKQYRPQVWIHGHTHYNVDYVYDKTRIVSNQRGYHPFELAENFRTSFILDL